MDLWNNKAGAEIGSKYRGGDAASKIAGDVFKALNDGKLITNFETDPRVNAGHGPSGGKGGSGGSGGGTGGSGGIGSAGGNAGTGGTEPPRRDPLVLDLDGDGIETTSTRDGTIILFDHDADGVKTGTGWVKPDDGWLVLDRNGNGTIDSGRELFGVDTLKSNGQLASNGFDALKDLDANNDGKINSADSVFANLRVWRDLNQDGISQTEELTTLDANSITAIGVNSSAVRTDLGNGNLQTAAGAFTRSNGTTGTTGETSSAAANLDLLVNTFYRQFSDEIPLTDQAKALPNLRGSGRVRDLSEAISLSTDLGNWVQTYTQQTTRQGQIDKLDGFIEKWANTADLKSLKAQAEALSSSAFRLTYNLAGLAAGTSAYDEFVRKLGVVERFMGFTYGGANGQARFTPLVASSGHLTVALTAEQIACVALAYDRFKTDIYESLLLRTRLGSYFDKLDIAVTDGRMALDFQPVENAFGQAIASSPRDGIIDLVEFLSAAGETRLAKLGWNATEFLTTQLNTTTDLGAFSKELSSWTVRFAASSEHRLAGTSRPDLIVASAGDDNIRGFDGNDILIGKAGDDTVDGGKGDDIVLGGAGNDSLSGGAGDDHLEGGDGNDWIQGDAGADTLDGGAGNDTLHGDYGNDTYLFGKGDGQDTISLDSDRAADKLNVLQFKAGVAPSEIVATRSGSYLVLSIAGTADEVSISNFFYSDDPANNYNPIQQIRFADGTTWDINGIKSQVFAGTAAADNIVGTTADDSISGQAGADTIYGRDGNDTLDGGADNDSLYGGNGTDTLNGGAGNDVLRGDAGNDTYLFGKGDGQDTIGLDYDQAAGKFNVLQFKAGVAPSEIVVARSDSNLVLSIAGTADKVTIGYFFYGDDPTNDYNPIQQIRFADGTTWDINTLKSKVFAGTAAADNIAGTIADDTITGQAGADAIYGRDGNDMLDGGADNDILYGENGADTLDGGAGDDVLSGGTGNDTYLFGKGDGQDTIRSTYDHAADQLNVLQFKAGVAPSEVMAMRSGSNLVLSIASAADKVTINHFFDNDNPANDYNPIQQVRFADGTTWDINTLKSKAFAGTASADNIVGTTADDTITGQAGADTIDGRDGNDTLDGGADNDVLSGGAGNDTYLFGKGDGQDTIKLDYDRVASKLNVLQFKAGVTPSEIVATRSGSYLVLSIAGTTDKVTISLFFDNDNPTNDYNPIQQVRFADGTTWDINGIKSKVFAGTAAADNIVGTTADDTISGQAGADTIYGRNGNDTLNGGADNDILYGENGADTLDGGAGDDVLSGGAGNDTYLFGKGDGQDTIRSTYDRAADKLNVLQFQAGVAPSEIMATRSGSNLVLSISGTADKVTLSDFFYNDDPTNNWNPIQQVRFADGTTWNINTLKSKVFAGTAAADYIFGTVADDTITGQAGADTIYGRDGNDTLDGGADNDHLYGGNGADTLNGGAGNDVLSGDAGNDTYLFGKGDGQDTISLDYDRAAGKLNVLQFKAGVVPSEIVVARSGSDLVLSIAGTADKVTIGYFFYTDDPANAYNPIQQVRFANGTTWDINALKSKVPGGTAATNNIVGTAAADRIVGTAADDTISGQAGADTIYGQDGNDTLYGGADNDLLSGQNGTDTLDGGAGDDVLSGGAGNDTYLFGKGDGQDTIGSDYDRAADKLNVLQFKAGVTPSEIVATRSGSYLVLSIAGTTDKVSIVDFFYNDNPANAYNPIQQVRFANGTTWDINALKSKVPGSTTATNNIVGTAAADRIVGTAADDTISGQAGADTIYGRDGNDTLYGGADNDILCGERGADTLNGEAGDDVLDGGAGNDTYLFGKGDGQDTIGADYDRAADKLNVLQFKAGVAPSEVVATRSDSYLVLSIAGTTDKVSIVDFFYNDDPANAYNPIQQVRFANGTTWDINALKSKVPKGTAATNNIVGTAAADYIVGTAADDTISGQAGVDTIDGRDGNDTLYGGADNDILSGENGADTLDGGAGNDVLGGGAGNDTYLFGKGDGQDTIGPDYDRAADKLNVLQFKAGVAPSEIVATRSNSYLVLSIAGTTDKVSISDFFYSDDPTNNWNPIQQVRFANGTTWDINGIKSKVFAGTAAADNIVGTTADDTITGQAGADTIYGRDGNDRLYGGADNDTLYGENGADTLDGGAGNDTLNGGNGNDTYVFGRGSGADSITDYDSTAGNTDCLSIGAGVSTNQLWLRRVGTDLEVSIIGTSDKSLINNWYAGNAYHIERFQTSNGNVLLDSQVNALVSAMAAFAPPPAGQTTLAADYQTALAPVLAAGWN
ncbi:calcium-binding protein [Verminephrobacter aporrectodeae subsp. tuberculatae]|uniref:Calcium-binding protein n=2 Tax=Verminephrobacter TaxID=364316 RepID=A0ABT3KX96_9BURK|nr:calcium-binding protein [Verminephrobacter aporrectodeae subsp. tuberculatae]